MTDALHFCGGIVYIDYGDEANFEKRQATVYGTCAKCGLRCRSIRKFTEDWTPQPVTEWTLHGP